MKNNIVTLTDSYKITHHDMYPEGTETVYSYFEARNGAQFPYTVFFGLQYLIKEYLEGEVVTTEMIDRAEKFAAIHFGNANLFKRERWDYIVREHGGRLPVCISAVAEGTVVPNSNVLMTIENTDPKCWWLTNHLETLLCHVWSSSTVATLSFYTKEMIKKYLEKTCDQGANFPGLGFMLHDFGMRGVSSMESAGIEGAGHLVNFMGTDTVIAMEYAAEFYNASLEGLAYSVPATEHSIMTSLGKEGEEEVIENLLNKYPEGILSVVSDSFNIYNCVENIYGKKFKDKILARNGKFVVRPDSGDPVSVVLELLRMLYDSFGGTVNKKGYKVLNPKIGLLWGDGLDYMKIEEILVAMEVRGWSAENIVFGMGGGLLQKINRDTQRFAFKSSAQMRNGVWYDVYKEPTDTSKKSKRGRLKLFKWGHLNYETTNYAGNGRDMLDKVFENGKITKEISFDEVRKNSLKN